MQFSSSRWWRTVWMCAIAGGLAFSAQAQGTWQTSGRTTPAPTSTNTQPRIQAALRDEVSFCQDTLALLPMDLGFRGAQVGVSHTYRIDHARAGASAQLTFSTALWHRFVLLSASDHGGSLKLVFWAVPPNGVISTEGVAGIRLGDFVPAFADGQGGTRDYLYNYEALPVSGTVPITNPPKGRYCLAVTVLEKWPTSRPCTSIDDKCIISLQTLKNDLVTQ